MLIFKLQLHLQSNFFQMVVLALVTTLQQSCSYACVSKNKLHMPNSDDLLKKICIQQNTLTRQQMHSPAQ